jgi:hypothetical protein
MDKAISVITRGRRLSVEKINKNENRILIISCAEKKRNILIPYGFQFNASSKRPLRISEKLCDRPHDTHGSPVISSCRQTTGYSPSSGEKTRE